MFWESNNLEISVFESRVVRLRTGKTALNTFKNIHLQPNKFESSKEGTGCWRVPATCTTSSGGAGGLGTLCGTCPQQASGRRLPSWPQCLGPSFNKGKGRLVLPFVKSNLSWVHFEADPAGGAGATLRAAEGPSTLACGKDSSSVLPGRVPFLLSNFSVVGFLQEKIFAASLTNIPISFYKRTLNSSVAKRKTAFHTILLFASFHRWVWRAFSSFTAMCAASGSTRWPGFVSRNWRATLVWAQGSVTGSNPARYCCTNGRVEGLCAQFLPRAAQSYGWASTISSYASLRCFKKLMVTLSPHSPSPCPPDL